MGKTIKLFLLDNKSTERIKCSVQGTLCVAFKIKRDDLDKPLYEDDKKLLNQSGIYFLFGETSDKSSKEIVYIGQAGVRKNGKALLNRIKEHSRKKDYWNEAVVFTTTDDSFGPTEISYLEHHFCNLAKDANRYIVKNGNEPMIGNIPKEDQYALEDFIKNTDIILSLLNYKVFVPIVERTTKKITNDTLYLTRTIRETGVTVKAKGQLTRDGFVVYKGSYISSMDFKAIPEKIKQQRKTAKIDKNRILQEDLHFTSPSYAAAFVIGSNVNGQTYWKTKDGIQLKDIINK